MELLYLDSKIDPLKATKMETIPEFSNVFGFKCTSKCAEKKPFSYPKVYQNFAPKLSKRMQEELIKIPQLPFV